MEKEMKQKIDEQLSAFLDDELPSEELEFLLRRLEKAEEARNTLNRYALIGSVLRNEYAGLNKDTLRAGVSKQLDGDADHAVRHNHKPAKAKAVRYRGLGVAAALAALAFLSVNNQSGPEIPPQVSQVVIEPTFQAVQQEGSLIAEPEMQHASITPVRLATYMVSHGEYARTFPWTVMDSRAMVQQASFEE